MTSTQRLQELPGVFWAASLATLWTIASLAVAMMGAHADVAWFVRASLVRMVLLVVFAVLLRWPLAAYVVAMGAMLYLHADPSNWVQGGVLMMAAIGYHLGRRTPLRQSLLLALIAVAISLGTSLYALRGSWGPAPGAVVLLQTVMGLLDGQVLTLVLPVVGGAVVRRQVAQAEAVERDAADVR